MVYHYTWVATDDCGNTTVVDQYITVVDETAPVFNIESATFEAECGAEVSLPAVSAIDNCGGDVTITSSELIVPGNCANNYTVFTTYTAVDYCGNSSSILFTVNYTDTTAPVWSADNAAAFTYECDQTAGVFQPVATDACSTVDYLYTDSSSESNGCTNSFVRSWIAVDACGNASAPFNQTITFEDTDVPVLIGCPGDFTLTCDAAVPAAAEVTATDNCDSEVSVSMEEACIGCPEDGTNGLQLFTPARPLDNPCNYPYDWAMALFSLPSNYRWYQLDNNTPAEMVYNADGTVTVTGRVFNVVLPTGGFDFNVTYGEAKDWTQWNTDGTPSGFKADCGGTDANFADWMYYILQPGANVELTGWGSHAGSLLNLTHAPSNEYFGFQIGVGANNYNTDNGAGGWFNYSGVFLYEGQPVTGGQAGGIGDFAFGIDQCPDYSIVRTWTAIDCAGNTSSCSQTILFSSQTSNFGAAPINCIPGSPCDDRDPATINDQYDRNCNCAGQNPAPMAGSYLVCPADGDVNCIGDVPSISFIGAAEAGFDAVVVVESTSIISGNDCDYTIARTWTVTFSNVETTITESCTAIFRIADFEAPVFVNAPENATYQCIEEVPAYANLEAVDGCGGEVIVQQFGFAPPRGRDACSQTIERRWAATDACGNVAYHTQIIQIEDTTPPTFINCPANVNVQCAADVPAPVSAADVNAADNCTGEVTVTYLGSDIVYTNGNCNFSITHTYTATDVCGNRESCSYTILVNDNIAPTLNVPASYSVECNADVFFEAASASDNCSPSLNLMEEVDTLQEGCIVTYVRSFSVSDDCGNATTGTQTINVIDTTAPVLSVPAGYSVQCNDDVDFQDASATDNCTSELTINVVVDTTVVNADCAYTYTRTFSVSDACGNTTTGVQVINVRDTEAPTFVSLAGPYYVECDAIYDDQWVRPAATDNCDSDLTYTYSDEMTSGGCLGVIHRTITITDNCGNSTTQEFIIYIQDTTAPIITWIPENAIVECSNVPSAPGVDAIQTTDNCGDAAAIYGYYAEGHNAEVTVSFEQQIIEGNCPGSYIILWIWTATDYCGNTTTATTTITVVDTTTPVFISNPENITIDCGDAIPGADIVVAADNCTGDLIIAVSSDNTVGGICAGQYLIERVYTATDDCGNVATYTQYIFVEDTTTPIFYPDNESTFAYECDEEVAVVTPAAVDDCSGVATSYTDVVNGGNCATYITRTWTATDGCGNQSSFVQNISVLDTEAPVIDFVTEIDRPCDDYTGIYATAFDNCDSDVEAVWVIDEFVAGSCAGRLVRTYAATDDCGNMTMVQQIITLVDTSAPLFEPQASIEQFNCASEVPLRTPALSDNCSEFELQHGDAIVTVEGELQLQRTWTATDACGNQSTWVEIFLLTLGEPGMTCDDGNPCTINDTVDENCTCQGTPAETAVSVDVIQACEPYTWNGQTYTVSGNYSFNTQTVLGCDSLARLALTVGTPTFSSQSVTNCGSYSWNGTTYTQSGTYTYVTTNSTGCPNTATLNLTVNNPSIAPSSVSASANNVSAGTSVTLTVQGGSLGTGASWKWYRGSCGGTLVGTGASITLTANVTETYYVRAEGTCNTTGCTAVTVNVLSAQCGPELVSASSTRICSGSSTTLSVLGTLYPGAIWRWRRTSCSGTIVGTGASLSVAPTATTTYYVRAEGGTCGITLCMSITIIVDKMPSTPSVISGQTSGLCNAQNVTYSVTPVSTVQQYNWTVPPGITIVSGQGTSSVTVNVSNFINTNPTNGNPAICVTAQNSCGISPIRCLSLTTYPATPASISGPTAPCINSVNTYSCPAVFGASSYTWQVPTGWVIQSGQGTASITVLCNGTAGNVRVRSVNACGNSTNRSLACAPAACSTTAMPMTLELWPNPTSDRVFFAHGDATPDHLQIYDMLGRDVYNGIWITDYDVSNLAGGIYFVRATSGGESVVKRMEVVR
jgi:hypothetical protein